MQKIVLGMLSVYMHISMCTSQVPEWLGKFYSYLILKSLLIIGQCLVNMNISARKTGGFHTSPTI
jgi:TRAP-type mannitol/chloroaromatic compound transport system permease small subunit